MKTLKKCASFVLAALFFCMPGAFAGGLEAVFLDVGTADCALFVSDGEAMMIDTGFTNADWEHVQEVLASNGVNTLKYLVLTHPHADHIGNAVRVAEKYDVASILLPPVEYDSMMYGSIVAAIDNKGIDKQYPDVGDTFKLGGAEIVVYGPHPVTYRNVNDWSLVLMIWCAGRSILMTGDIEAEAESDLLWYNDIYPVAADVIKVAHHGSDTSSTFAFIQAVSPTYAIVSCGSKGNRDYPHVETAMTLYDCGVMDILTTEKAGDIYLIIGADGEISFQRDVEDAT